MSVMWSCIKYINLPEPLLWKINQRASSSDLRLHQQLVFISSGRCTAFTVPAFNGSASPNTMFHTCSTVATVRLRFLSPPTTICLPCANVSYQSTHGVTCVYVYVYVCAGATCGVDRVSDGLLRFRIILCCQRTSIWRCQRPQGKEQVESAESWEMWVQACLKHMDVGAAL